MKADRDSQQILSFQKWNDEELLKSVYEFVFGQPTRASDKENDSTRAAVVILVAFHRDANVPRLAKMTGYSVAFVQQIAERMKKSGIWKGEMVDCEYWIRGGLAAFILDLLVAEGEFGRLSQKNEKGHYI